MPPRSRGRRPECLRAGLPIRPSLRGLRPFSTWLFTIARNLCLNELRRRSRHPADSIKPPTPTRRTMRSTNSRTNGPPRRPTCSCTGVRPEDRAGPGGPPRKPAPSPPPCRQDELSYGGCADVLGCSPSATTPSSIADARRSDTSSNPTSAPATGAAMTGGRPDAFAPIGRAGP